MKIFFTLFISLTCCLCLSAQSKNTVKTFNKGLDYFQEQAYSEALDQFKSVIWADPDHEAAHHFLAQIYSEQGKSSFAIKHLKRVLAINSDREESWVELAKAYTINEQKDKAVSTLEKAIKINSEFQNVKLELDNLNKPSVMVEPDRVEEAVAYEPVNLGIQPPAATEIVSIDNESSMLLEKHSSAITSRSKPIIIPVYKMEDEVGLMAPIPKEEVMAPAPSLENSRKQRKGSNENAGPAAKEEMAAAILSELLPAFEADESFEEVVKEGKTEKIDEIISKEEIETYVTFRPEKETLETKDAEVVAEELSEEVEKMNEEIETIQEEVVPSFSSTPRIPGIRMPSAVDYVIKAQAEAKRNKKRKN